MKVKELKDIIAYLEDGGRKTLEGSVEKFIEVSKSYGFNDEFIFERQQDNGMTPAATMTSMKSLISLCVFSISNTE